MLMSLLYVSLIRLLLPKALHSELILSSLQLMLCRVAAVKRPSYIIIVQIIYFLVHFDIIGLILSQFENSVPLKAWAV